MTLNNFRRFFKELVDASEMYVQERFTGIKDTNNFTLFILQIDSYYCCQLIKSNEINCKEKYWIEMAKNEITNGNASKNLYFFYDKLTNHLKPITPKKALNILECLVY